MSQKGKKIIAHIFGYLKFLNLENSRSNCIGTLFVQLPCEQFLRGFKIFRAFLCARQMEGRREKIQNPVKSLIRQLL